MRPSHPPCLNNAIVVMLPSSRPSIAAFGFISAMAALALLASCGGGSTDHLPAPPGSGTGSTAPAVPTAVIAIAGSGGATVRWDAMHGATSYSVLRSTTDGGPYAPVVSNVATTSYSDAPLANGTRYFYVVRAHNGHGTSANSVQARTTPVTTPVAGSVYWPLSGSSMADADGVRFPFGPRRITNYDFHGGIDIPAAQGTPVYPLMHGTVTALRNDWVPGSGSGAGNYVLVNHGQQKWTAYLHLDTVTVTVGASVSAGATQLGTVGATGANTNHLHLTYMVGLVSEASSEARSKNPLEILPHTPLPTAAPYVPGASFRTDGSNTVDITLPTHRMTMRWAILRGDGQTRMLDYYEIVSQGSVARNNQNQPAPPGLHLDASAPALPDPATGQNFVLSLRPNPVGDFTVQRVTLLDYNGNTILDATRP